MSDKFTATFTLTQDGPDGDVVSKLEFNPLVSRENANEAPVAYEIMAHLAQEYLFITGVIDEEGNLIEPDAFHANTHLNVSTLGSSGKLN